MSEEIEDSSKETEILVLKNKLSETKSLDGINSRMDTEEERINEFKCKLIKSKLNLKQEVAKRGSVNLALLVKLAKTEEKNLTAVKKQGFPGGSAVKNLPANAGDVDSIPGLGTPL